MADIEKKQEMNPRRRFLVAATSIAGGIAGAAVATPFVLSMMPSERAKAAGAPVEVDISKIEPGMLLLVEWRGKVVWILDRTPEMLTTLKKLDSQVADPKSEKPQQPAYCQNETRSIKPAILVVEGVCTHLGCSPVYRKDIAPADLGSDWLGGFFCPCHGSKFDLAGRVYKSVPAPTNLIVPPHMYLTDTQLLIGSDRKESA
jgi:ubiquinol-cytochrome c reductase iron-sulfur subunit